MIKKKILCNKLIHDLINIAIGACDEKECDKSTHRLRLTALRALGNVGGMMNKKTYIPGESRENEKIRQFFISQGRNNSLQKVYLYILIVIRRTVGVIGNFEKRYRRRDQKNRGKMHLWFRRTIGLAAAARYIADIQAISRRKEKKFDH